MRDSRKDRSSRELRNFANVSRCLRSVMWRLSLYRTAAQGGGKLCVALVDVAAELHFAVVAGKRRPVENIDANGLRQRDVIVRSAAGEPGDFPGPELPAQQPGRERRRLLDPNASMADRACIALEGGLRRRVVQIDGVRIG